MLRWGALGRNLNRVRRAGLARGVQYRSVFRRVIPAFKVGLV